MQGVLARGTARSIANFSPYVAGKTGTSDDENDAWFVGFTNDVTVAVWIGYDNADGKRRTLGGGSTGGGVAVPIFEPVMQAVWNHIAPKVALAPPSEEAKRRLSCRGIDPDSGEEQRRGGITECFRIDRKGKIIDTQYRLLSREKAYARRGRDDDDDDDDRPRRISRQRSDDNNRTRQVVRQRAYVDPWRAQWGWGWGQRYYWGR
jgi:penicillin-binding protein 1A